MSIGSPPAETLENAKTLQIPYRRGIGSEVVPDIIPYLLLRILLPIPNILPRGAVLRESARRAQTQEYGL